MHYMITFVKESNKILKIDRLGNLSASRFRGLLSVFPGLIHADIGSHIGIAMDTYKNEDILYFLFENNSNSFSFRSRSEVAHSLRYYNNCAEPCLNWFHSLEADIEMPEEEFYEKYKEQAEATAPTS